MHPTPASGAADAHPFAPEASVAQLRPTQAPSNQSPQPLSTQTSPNHPYHQSPQASSTQPSSTQARPTEPTQRQRVVDVARSWLGTPYHHRARIKGAGADCGMILIAIYAEAGVIDDFDPGPYPRDWMMHRDEERYLGIVQRFAHPVDTPKPGDIAVFRYGRCVSHGAVVVDWPTVVHAYVGQGVVLDDAQRNPALAQRLAGFYSVWR